MTWLLTNIFDQCPYLQPQVLLLPGTYFAEHCGLGFYLKAMPSFNLELHVYGPAKSILLLKGDFLKTET